MNIFGGIYSTVHGPSLKRSKFKLERAAANARIQTLERAIAFREKEDVREQAFQKQAMFGRGLGKSTIADQEKGRLLHMQSDKMANLRSAHHVAVRYKQYLKKRQNYERKSQYAQYLDSIVNTAMGVGTLGIGGGQTDTSQNTAYPSNPGDYNTTGSVSSGAYA